MSQDWDDDVYAAGSEVLLNMQQIEDNLACLKTCFSGAAAPSVTLAAGMFWLDTTNKLLKQYNGSTWVTIYNYNTGRLIMLPTDATILAAHLATDSVETAKIKDGNVTTAKILAGAITTEKILDSAVTAEKLLAGAFTYAKLPSITAGNYRISALQVGEYPIVGTTPTKVGEFKVGQGGVYRCKWNQKKGDGYGAGSYPWGRIYVNDVAIGTSKASTGSDTDYHLQTDDITLSAGDLVQLYGWCNYAPGTATFTAFRLCASTAAVYPGMNESYL